MLRGTLRSSSSLADTAENGESGVVAKRSKASDYSESRFDQKSAARARMTASDENDEDRTRAHVFSSQKILHEHLDTNRKQDSIWIFLRCGRLERLLKAAAFERARREQDSYVHLFPCIHRVVKSGTFEMIVGLLMCVNAGMIGAQISVAGTDSETEVYDLLEHVFTALFILEVTLRLLSDGWPWIFRIANFGDAALIFFTGVVPMWILAPLGVDTASMRLFSIARVLRMIKLVRMVRMIPSFQVLYQLVIGLVGSLRLLLFTYLMMGILLYAIAVFSVYGVGKAPVFQDDQLAQENFHNVPAAIYALIQVMTCDWTSIARPLMKKSSLVLLVCTTVLGVVTLVVLNLITAVICNGALARAKDDEEIMAREKRDKVAREIKSLQELFWELDKDGSGTLSKEEYLHATRENERVKLKLQVLGISPGEAKEIWGLIAEGPGDVAVDAFADTLRALQGDVKAKDTFTIQRRIGRANVRIQKCTQRLEGLVAKAAGLEGLAMELDKEVGQAIHQVHELVKPLSKCIPHEPALRKKEDIEAFNLRVAEGALLLW